MNSASGISTVFWIFWMVSTRLCVTKGTFTALSMNWVPEIATVSCSTSNLTLSMNCNCGISNPSSHWDLSLRQDRNCDVLVDELTVTAEPPSTVWAIGACRFASTGTSKSHPCSRAVPVTWSRLPMSLASLLSRVSKEDETVDSSGHFCCEELDLVPNPDWDLLHRSLFRLDSSWLHAPLCLLFALLFFTSCRAALLPAVGPFHAPAVGPLFPF